MTTGSPPNCFTRVEAYYQRLYNLPVENDPNSYFSTINEGAELDYVALVNEGTYRNYGLSHGSASLPMAITSCSILDLSIQL